MSLLTLTLVGAALLPPQGEEKLFVVKTGDHATVSSNRRAVTPTKALELLGGAMNWVVVFQTPSLRTDLSRVSLDLAFDDQDPRIVAQLVAASADADVIFADGTLTSDQVTMHVVSNPDEFSVEGQQRLRARATQWYQNFLIDEIQRDPTLDEAAMQVRMQVGGLLQESGDLDGAIRFFSQIPEQDRIHGLALPATLRVAECYLELEDFENAEVWTKKILTERYGNPPQKAKATILMGRILIATGRYEECIQRLEARALRLDRRPDILDLYLLLGTAHFHLNQPAQASRRMETLARLMEEWRELTEEQWLQYHFLRGYGAVGTEQFEKAVRFLEWFLIRAEGDKRRGMAFVLLSQAYLGQNKYLEARAAALEATNGHHQHLDDGWRRQARKLSARTALILGDKQEAFDQLEREVIQHRDPELTLFLVDEFMKDRRWQRAINTARALLDRTDRDFADQGRLRIVKAMFEQSKNVDNWRGFADETRRLALAMSESPLRVQVVELLAKAYESMGEVELAADAIRGVLWRQR